jgi:hypothetical protein
MSQKNKLANPARFSPILQAGHEELLRVNRVPTIVKFMSDSKKATKEWEYEYGKGGIHS